MFLINSSQIFPICMFTQKSKIQISEIFRKKISCFKSTDYICIYHSKYSEKGTVYLNMS